MAHLIKVISLLFIFVSWQSFADKPYIAYGANFSQTVEHYHYYGPEQVKNTPEFSPFNQNGVLWQTIDSHDAKVLILKGENWLSFELANDQSLAQIIYFSVKNSLYLNEAKLFVDFGGQAIRETQLNVNMNNARISRLLFAGKTKATLYLKLVADKDIELSMNLAGDVSYLNESREQEFLNGVAIGGSAFLALGVLFLFFASGSKSILLLCGYFSARALGLAILLGSNFAYFFPDSPDFKGHDMPLVASSIGLFLLWFSSELFSLKKRHAHFHKWIKISCWALLCFMPVSWFLPLHINLALCMLLHHFITILLAYIGFRLAQNKVQLARLFTVIMVLQFVFALFVTVGVTWFNMTLFDDSESIYSISFSLNGMLLIFLVSRLFYVQVKDKEVAQKSALTNALKAKRAQDELLELQQENQEQLESRVQERTLELNIAFQELESLNKELAEKTTIDDLTGLNNRRFFDQKIQAEFRRSRRNLTPLSLIVIDVDHFKLVNDSYGHLVGDECLVWLANHMKSNVRRSSDIACRYGGEEFCFILPETDAEGAAQLAEELRANVEAVPMKYKDLNISMTISCGIATYQQQEHANVENLFVAADKALYEAKNSGRNTVKSYLLENLLEN